uniref:Histone-lysine N-methyltransferase n=1 Tax=Heterorhabditis bacteriophora TaxID=37862 RepID=A0A1I7WNM2_HETBA
MREDSIDSKVEEYEEIPRKWECPVLSCGCARGACTSDAECVNRALCVQCPPGCAAPLCANKKFWKDDSVKQLIASGSKTKRILRTKQARRAGDFLCEYAGEVVSYIEAVRRYQQYSELDMQPLMLCLTSKLFVDASVKGNISRYVRHSCRPNARLEVWCVNGTYRAGLFSLVDIASGVEITIDMSGLLLNNQECKCGAAACRGLLKRSRNATIAGALDLSIQEERRVRSKKLFLVRNRQQTIERATICIILLYIIGLYGSIPDLGPKSSNVIPGTLSALRVVLKGLSHRIRRVDGSLPYEAVAGYSRVMKILHTGKFINQDTNLAYIDSDHPVGSYDPDAAWPVGPANEGDDAVCLCDSCHFWLHSECLGQVDQSTVSFIKIHNLLSVFTKASTQNLIIIKYFKEADVYICEYQIDRNQRSFEKIPPKNRYPVNTQPYVFRNFVEPLILKRDFTPFIVEPSPAPSRLNQRADSAAGGLDLRSIVCFMHYPIYP